MSDPNRTRWQLISFRDYVSWLVRYMNDTEKRAFYAEAKTNIEERVQSIGNTSEVEVG